MQPIVKIQPKSVVRFNRFSSIFSLLLVFLLSCLTTATLGLLFDVLALQLNACEFGIDHDATAVFANDNLLAHTDVELALGRDLVEASAAGVALDIYDAESVA